MEVDTPLEEQVMKINESIQGFHVNILDLEDHTTPSTPLEERENIFQVRIPFLLVLGKHFLINIDEDFIRGFDQTISLWIVQSRVSQIFVIILAKFD